jgi:hypothetical protein
MSTPSPPTTADEREREWRAKIDKLLDEPVSCRALFVATVYLAETIARGERSDFDSDDQNNLLCFRFVTSFEEVSAALAPNMDFRDSLKRSEEIERQETIKKFNDSLQ